tara:strand:- start:2201 stop:3220 length:1020 start_codon:yes stop_codon:yes gene_type:complete
MKSNVLITGGLGYIGSHLYISLINEGYNPIIVDDLSNSSKNILENLKRITNLNKINFYYNKIQDTKSIKEIIISNKIESVFHLAGFKSIEESNIFPYKYYNNNINSTLSLLDAMSKTDCNKIIFSSSACVYGNTSKAPVKEMDPLMPLNVYAHTKLICENMINMTASLNNKIKYANLRYFNPAGAHESGFIGEHAQEISKNLFPVIANLANKSGNELYIYGSDYNTPDGTPIRDYIHIMDLVEGHIKALNYISDDKDSITINLGTGKGVSVLEVINSYNKIAETKLNYVFKERRKGDAECCYADTSLARELINWSAKRNLEEIWSSIFKWNYEYPNGYD